MKKQPTVEEIQLGVALFEGRQITPEEAKRVRNTIARRSKMLARTFKLSSEEVTILCVHSDEVANILKEFCEKKQEETKARLREIEARAIRKMRDPRRERQLKALLSAR